METARMAFVQVLASVEIVCFHLTAILDCIVTIRYSMVENFTCQNVTASGSPCVSSEECAAGTVCFQKTAGGNLTCQAMGSQGSGGPCVTGACAAGFGCPYPPANQTCVSVTTDVTNCNNDTDCPGSSCQCSPFVGKSFCTGPTYDPCTQENFDLTTCLANGKCVADESSTCTTGSCCDTNCQSQYKKLRSCFCPFISDAFGSCNYDSYCGGFPVWAIIVIIVAVIALILAVVIVVVLYLRNKRKRQYESI